MEGFLPLLIILSVIVSISNSINKKKQEEAKKAQQVRGKIAQPAAAQPTVRLERAENTGETQRVAKQVVQPTPRQEMLPSIDHRMSDPGHLIEDHPAYDPEQKYSPAEPGEESLTGEQTQEGCAAEHALRPKWDNAYEQETARNAFVIDRRRLAEGFVLMEILGKRGGRNGLPRYPGR